MRFAFSVVSVHKGLKCVYHHDHDYNRLKLVAINYIIGNDSRGQRGHVPHPRCVGGGGHCSATSFMSQVMKLVT